VTFAVNGRANGDGRNPVLPPDVHLPDGEARVMPDGRLYVYGSWDQQDDRFCSPQYRVASTADLRTWTDHGVSFDISRVPWTGTPDATRWPGYDWTNPTPFMRLLGATGDQPAPEGGMLFAPDAIHRGGRYYLYFCGSDDSEGVAVADRPEGPFHDAVQLACGGIDPAVFVDDDGQAYYYWGQYAARGAKLADDMRSLVPGSTVHDVLTEEMHFFHEGTSIRKVGDTYVAVYSSIERGAPTTLSYATSRSPLGPFEHRGVVIDNARCDPSTWNNHGSIEAFAGQWYVFYHRSSRRSMSWRRLCVEPLVIEDGGAIAEVPMTSQGSGRPFGLGEGIEAWRACEVVGGAFVGPGEDGSERLRGLTPGAAGAFRWVELDEPATTVEIVGRGHGVIEVCAGGVVVGAVALSQGRSARSAVALPPGRHELWLRGGADSDAEVETIILTRNSTAPLASA
jgi:arabinoxylan arabinofuranohydrolase